MALTVISTPQDYAPIYNGLKFVFSSTNVGNTGFEFSFEVSVEVLTDSGGTIITSPLIKTYHRTSPHPVSGYGIIDVMRVVESLFTNDSLDDLDSNFLEDYKGVGRIVISIAESWKVSGVQVDQPFSPFNVASCRVFAGALDVVEFQSFDCDDYTLTDATSKFLTNAPRNQRIKIDERAWLYTLCIDADDYGRRQVKTYNSAGTLLNTYNTTNTLGDDPTYFSTRFLRTTSGPAQLSDFGVSFSGVSYYTVQAQKTDGTPISELMTYTLDTFCSKYEPVRIHFLNNFGKFDSFTFDLVSSESDSIKRTDYKKAQPTTYTLRDRLNSISSVVSQRSKTINSNWVTEEEHLWLRELITSPIIYIEENDSLIAVNCTDVKFKEEKKVNNKLFNITMNLEYTFENNRQRY